MKKWTSIATSITVTLTAVVLLVLIIIQIKESNQPSTVPSSAISELINSTANYPSSQESSNITVMTSQSTIYVVKTYSGHIGVFANNSNVPFEEIDVDVSTLPQMDQNLLSKGIEVTSESKLNKLLEDYKS
jgi:hypothetical protein